MAGGAIHGSAAETAPKGGSPLFHIERKAYTTSRQQDGDLPAPPQTAIRLPVTDWAAPCDPLLILRRLHAWAQGPHTLADQARPRIPISQWGGDLMCLA